SRSSAPRGGSPAPDPPPAPPYRGGPPTPPPGGLTMGKPFEIRKEIPLNATPEQVWEAIATGPGLTAWFMPMEVDADSSMVTSWEPGRRLAIRTPSAPDGSFQAFEYRIEAVGQGSTVL